MANEAGSEPQPVGEERSRPVVGDGSGLVLPSHLKALRTAGCDWLTTAFRCQDVLAPDSRVTAITRLVECPGGSTGRKAFLRIETAAPSPALDHDLFVKFSRDFDDPIRDRGKRQMEAEVRFSALSKAAGFPIEVPACFFADYHHESGTGILITQRIAFGEGLVEPHHDKCLDYRLDDPLAHYEILVDAVARLAGTAKAGELTGDVERLFPYDAAAMRATDPIRYDAQRMANRIARYAAFADEFPQLLPQPIRERRFIARLEKEVPRFLDAEAAIKSKLHAPGDLIALTHWNANIDNAWFWRDETGVLRCGLMDWGRVGQMNIALALWGSLSAAEPDMLEAHFDTLLARFVRVFAEAGGPAIGTERLRRHFDMFVATMGLAWLMDAPPLIRRCVPDLAAAESRHDPRFAADEMARTQLYMLSNFLSLWKRHDFGASLREFLGGD